MLTLTKRSAIGWVGTGVMGASMCAHLIKAGYPVVVHSRSKEKALALIDRGARWGESPQAVAAASDVVITMVGFPNDVRDVYLSEAGLLRGATPGMIFIDMTTTSPSLARELHERACARSCWTVDAPVSGGDIGARNATLSIMIGGDKQAVQAVMPLFEALGQTIVHHGEAGSGQHAKLCNQIVIAGTMIGVCESLVYGYRAGLDLTRMLRSIGGGAAACWTLAHLAPRILQRDFAPGFFVEHFVKDMQLVLEESRRMGVTLPGLTLVHGLYQSVIAMGRGRSGTHALMLALERLSSVTVATPP
ncbi:MAG TPA: NAD(P)-dependent oxidoreductase [Nitrospira sp.]|nr:NAD(P)-dependent oxidoreductase [Nitrospira sp.]